MKTYFPASSPSTRLAPRGRGSCLGLRTGVSPHFSTNSIREMLVPLGCSARQQHQTRQWPVVHAVTSGGSGVGRPLAVRAVGSAHDGRPPGSADQRPSRSSPPTRPAGIVADVIAAAAAGAAETAAAAPAAAAAPIGAAARTGRRRRRRSPPAHHRYDDVIRQRDGRAREYYYQLIIVAPSFPAPTRFNVRATRVKRPTLSRLRCYVLLGSRTAAWVVHETICRSIYFRRHLAKLGREHDTPWRVRMIDRRARSWSMRFMFATLLSNNIVRHRRYIYYYCYRYLLIFLILLCD